MNDDPRSEWLTPPEIAKELRKRTSWPIKKIESGELPAINLSDGKRPRYLVRRADLEEFLRRRAVTATPKPTRRDRRGDIPRYV